MKHQSNAIQRQTNNFLGGNIGLGVNIYGEDHTKLMAGYPEEIESQAQRQLLSPQANTSYN